MSLSSVWTAPPRAALALLAIVAVLQGCKEAPVVVQRPTGTVFAADLRGGAKRCVVPENVAVASGKTTDSTMSLGNDGGWCAVKLSQPGDKPFGAGLLVDRPTHGKVYVHTVGVDTRIDYTPDERYVGDDSFSVKLLPGDATIREKVSVAAN